MLGMIQLFTFDKMNENIWSPEVVLDPDVKFTLTLLNWRLLKNSILPGIQIWSYST